MVNSNDDPSGREGASHANDASASAGGSAASGKGSAWLAALGGISPTGPIRLARGPDEVNYLVEGEVRRKLTSPLVLAALEKRFGARKILARSEFATLAEGPPVAVMKAPRTPPFVIVGGQRMQLVGLPAVHGVSVEEALGFDLGAPLDVRPRLRPVDTDGLAPLPTFVIVGAQKSATRWLRINLGAHPEICTANAELNHFLRADSAGKAALDGYRARFEKWSGERILGEATPGYMMWHQNPDAVAARIGEALPDVRILAILRNPVDRAHSAMLHHIARGRIPPDTDLLAYARRIDPNADRLGLISGGWYGKSLSPYFRRFSDRVLVLLQEDLTKDAVGVYRAACRHVGASTEFTPEQLSVVRHPNKEVVGEALTQAAREELFEFFREDVATLEELIGRDLSHWDPKRAHSDAP